jgi:TetR/AcrR family transcriptional regulator, transcriptional repressor for nem operon
MGRAAIQSAPGRASSSVRDNVRAKLIRLGTEVLSEKGFGAAGLEELLSKAGTPKGSFYYYFPSKVDFGLAVVDNYAFIWEQKLTRLLGDPNVRPLDRIANYLDEGIRGLRKYSFTRGCLVGNMSQEISSLDEVFRAKISKVFASWSEHVRSCLDEAIDAGELDRAVDSHALADFFWMGWEGAILKAKLERSIEPVEVFRRIFFSMIFLRNRP